MGEEKTASLPPIQEMGAGQTTDGSSDQSQLSSAVRADDEQPGSFKAADTPNLESGGPAEPVSVLVSPYAPKYDQFSKCRKRLIVLIVTMAGFMVPIASIALLCATPEIAKEFETTNHIICISNGVYVLSLGLSSVFWGPTSQVFGRKNTLLLATSIFFVASIGTAAAPCLAAFFFFRILSASQVMGFVIIGNACVGDIYMPIELGTANGWYQAGSLVGAAVGPFIGGAIISLSQWRVIYWLQTAMTGVVVITIFVWLPETISHKKIDDMLQLSRLKMIKNLAGALNPWRPVKLFQYPNLAMIAFTGGAIIWNMYGLFTPIRFTLSSAYELKSPLTVGIVCLAPGIGYVAGGLLGGFLSDMVTKTFIKRTGEFVPEHRLWTVVPCCGFVLPVCMLGYGWAVQTRVGGLPLAVAMMVTQGLAHQASFPAIMAYCIDVMPQNSGEVIAGTFFARYFFSCIASAVALPMIDAVGIGWFSTLNAVILWLGSASLLGTILFGRRCRESVDSKRAARAARAAGASPSVSTKS